MGGVAAGGGPGQPHPGVGALHTAGQRDGGPPGTGQACYNIPGMSQDSLARDAGGATGSLYQAVAPVTLEHYLPSVLDLPRNNIVLLTIGLYKV